MLIDIVKELTKRTRQLRDFENGGIISYSLQGKIIYESKGRKRNLHFEGRLIYRTTFENYPLKTKKRRPLNAGKMSSSPSKNGRSKVDYIVYVAKDMAQERYRVSYDDKEDMIKIQALGDLEKELRRINKVSGSPIKLEFNI